MPRKAAAPGSDAATTPLRRTRSSLPMAPVVIPDSEDELSFTSPLSTFKGVFIPLKEPEESSAPVPKMTIPPKKRPSVASSLSSVETGSPFTTRDASEIRTADTSLVSTPGAISSSSKGPYPWLSKNGAFPPSNTIPSKRKRSSAIDSSISADAELARALQEEEYGNDQASSSRPSKSKKSKLSHSTSLSSLPHKDIYLVDSDSDAPGDLIGSRDLKKKSAKSSSKTKGKGKAKAVESVDVSDSESVPLWKGKGKAAVKDESDLDLSLSKPSKGKAKVHVKAERSTGSHRKAKSSAHAALKETARLIADSEDDGSDLSDFIDNESESRPSEMRHFEGESLDEDDSDEVEDIPLPRPTGVNGAYAAEDWSTYHARTMLYKRQTRAERERVKLEKAHPEVLTMWQELEDVPKIVTEQAEQPASINRKLKSFQLEGLNWMIKQEQTKWKGGLLGDEMGMGKTIQAVSLIMSDYPTQPHKPTLVLVPPVALMQWTNEIRNYTSGQLKVLVYHGSNAKSKKMSVKELKSYDVIMCSYAGLQSLYKKQTKGWTRGENIIKEDSALHAITYHRIILDEAHSIKSRTTGVAKACFALKGEFKWCLSGTPVQNRIGEFFSLLRFLDVQPFANYLCKKCDCSTPDWSTSGDYKCDHCKHRTLDHVSVFNQEILNPVVSGETEATRKAGLAKLRLLTDRIMLRRIKRDHTSSMELPPKEVIIHNEFFGEIERDFSSSIMTNTNRQFDTYVSRGVMLNNYANIFGLIMQMRQVANHPDLLLKRHAEAGQNVLVCNICDEPAEEAIRSACKHEFCRVCVKDYVKTCDASGATPDCPRCHITLAIDLEQPDIEQDTDAVKRSSIINRIKMENWHSSTKIEMLVYDLYKLRSNKQTLKSIVFSQFTSMLSLVEWRLRRAGFNTVMLDGTMTPAQRQKSIEHFMTNTDVEVFLVSLKAGGVALNLTEASRVFIIDPWWNPAAEWQSADRCHRIGQKRPCVITRLCVEDSVESRIVMLQEKKANLINGTVNNDDVAMEKLTPEDMQFLFRGS